jgi:hypothetical protein
MMGMTEFVWRLHGGWKGFGRAILRDGLYWAILGLMIYEDWVNLGGGFFFGFLLAVHGITRMHLDWYRDALTQTQGWLDHSIEYMKKDQQAKWRAMIERETTQGKDFN